MFAAKLLAAPHGARPSDEAMRPPRTPPLRRTSRLGRKRAGRKRCGAETAVRSGLLAAPQPPPPAPPERPVPL
eukprot:231118-Prymnesium_polylepis.1